MYTELFKRIIDGRYPPGTRLKEEELAEEFQLSRTPVREVLRQLENDDLVKITPRRGAEVVSFTADDIEDIYEIRRVLELLALDIAGSSLSLRELGDIRSELLKNSQSKDYLKHAELDARLHNYIISSSGRRYLNSMLGQMLRLIQRFREFGFQDDDARIRTMEEHLQFIDALCVRDIDKAKEILSRHIINSKTRALSQLLKRKNV